MMSLTEQLTSYYGSATEEILSFLADQEKNLSDKVQLTIYDKIVEKRPIKQGFPDVNYLTKMIEAVQKNERTYYWSRCDECGKEYMFDMPCCPYCYDNGKIIRARVVVTSKQPSQTRLYGWNKNWFAPDNLGPLCCNCDKRKDSYCSHFGNSSYSCKQGDFEFCECKSCCSKIKKQNQAYYDYIGGKK